MMVARFKISFLLLLLPHYFDFLEFDCPDSPPPSNFSFPDFYFLHFGFPDFGYLDFDFPDFGIPDFVIPDFDLPELDFLSFVFPDLEYQGRSRKTQGMPRESRGILREPEGIISCGMASATLVKRYLAQLWHNISASNQIKKMIIVSVEPVSPNPPDISPSL